MGGWRGNAIVEGGDGVGDVVEVTSFKKVDCGGDDGDGGADNVVSSSSSMTRGEE